MITQRMLVNGGSASSYGPSWTYTIDTSLYGDGLTGAVPFNMYMQDESIVLTVDWGDGETSTLTYEDVDSTDAGTNVHTYEEAGTYTITVYSKQWDLVYIDASMYDDTSTNVEIFRGTLIRVDTPLPELAGIRSISQLLSISLVDNSAAYIFCHCTNLTSVTKGLFDNCAAVTSFERIFYGCSCLASIPEGLFDNCTAVTTFAWAFRACDSLVSIPDDLFANNTAVTTFAYTFYEDSDLEGFDLHIGSELVSTATSFVTKNSTYTRTVYVPAGSTTADTFNALSLGMTIVEEE